MTSERPGANLIENYLQSRGSRYFRGHHDGEFFYVANTRPRRLHVHLEITPTHGDVLVIRVAPSCFFPATERARLTEFADAWNQQNRGVTATLHDSSDPQRIGVVAGRSQWIPEGADFDAFASFVDATLADAIDLFGQLAALAESSASAPLVRDAS
jgi:hypothetical protein